MRQTPCVFAMSSSCFPERRLRRRFEQRRTFPLAQFLHRKIDIVHREIQHRERRRDIIRLGINENVVSAGEMQGQQPVLFTAAAYIDENSSRMKSNVGIVSAQSC
jgi:hypothetical protein